MESGIRIHEEYARLRERQRAAMERLGTLLCTYDDMILQQKPRWEAKYIEVFGALEQQCYAAFVRASELRRRIALARAYVNRGAQPNAAEIDAQIAKEFHEYEEKLRRMEAERARAMQILGGKRLSSEETKRFKHLYRQLAKKLHPDLHPEQTEEMKRLWQRAMDAYALGDLARLEIVAAIAESKFTEDDEASDAAQSVTANALTALRTQLEKTEERIAKCIAALDHLEQEHPFKHIVLLENPRAVEERRESLRAQLRHYMEEIPPLEAHLEMLLMGRATVLH